MDPAAETALARHGEAVATAREFALRANALRVVLLIDRGDDDAPLGAIEHLAQALTAVARDLGNRSVATAEFATSDPETPITLAARQGEPAVLAAGDQEYRLGR